MVTTVPPVLGPVFGLIEETDGAGSGAGPTKVPSTATPIGPLSPVAPPEMVAIGATLPVAPGANSGTVVALQLPTNTFPAGSTAIPSG